MDRAVLLERGEAAFARGDLAAATASWREVLAQIPDDDAALTNLAAALNASGQFLAAEAACRAALACHPGHWGALANLGVALHRQQRLGEAVAAYAASLRAQPANADVCTNLAVALTEQWRIDEALTLHAAAMALAPEDAEVRSNRALALLTAGDLAQGFAENEWRWRCAGMRPHGVPGPVWAGENPAGLHILLHEEGGFGDTLQFIRYASLLAARGAEVTVVVRPPLLRLLRQSLPGVAILPIGEALPAYDRHCPMVSLPHGFATTLATVPAMIPYLHADPAAAECWRTRLAAALGDARRVGLVWAGAPRPDMPIAHAMDGRRSIGPARFAPLAAVPGCRLVSLQHQAVPPPELPVFDAMAEIGDFADTAALIMGLDLVIAVDTAVAHLAGALGRPVWLLSRHDACWRWIAHRRDSPWYPGLRLYRQPAPGDWDSVVAAVTQDLTGWAAAAPPPGLDSDRTPQGSSSGRQAPPPRPPARRRRR
jgi:Flp pilus assembly protein TadD